MRERMKPRFGRLAAAAILAAAGASALPASSLGEAATVAHISDSFEFGPVMVDDTCAGPGVMAVLIGTGTVTGNVVERPDGFHFRIVTRTHARFEYADGSYMLESQREGFVFNSAEPTVTQGGTTQAKGTLYDAAGNIIGYETVHASFRLTIANGNTTVDFHKFRLSCR